MSWQTYSPKHWNQETGLAESYVYTIAQDDRGFLYLGSAEGVFRFDGAVFRRFTTADGLAANFTNSSFKARNGDLWFGHYEGELSVLHNRRFQLVDSTHIEGSITGFGQDSKGNLWCASQRSGIFLIDSTGVKQSFKDELQGKTIHAFAISPKDEILIGTDEGLMVFEIKGNAVKLAYESTKIPTTKVQCIQPRRRQKGFWIGTEDQGLFEFLANGQDAADSVTQFDETKGWPLSNVQSVFEDNAENVWVGTYGTGFMKFNDSRVGERLQLVKAFRKDDAIGEAIVRCIFQDQFGQIWLGTYGDGLWGLSDANFSAFKIADTLSGKAEILCTMEDRRGDFWFGTSNGIYVIDRNVVASYNDQFTFSRLIALPAKKHFGSKEGLLDLQINALFEDADDRIWVGTGHNGIAFLEPGGEKFTPKALSEFSLSNIIKGITQDKSGLLWISTSDGAYSYDFLNDESHYYSTRNGLSHNNIYHIFPDSKGRVWFAMHTNLLSVFDGQSLQTIEVTENGEIPNVTCIAEAKDGTIWLGTNGMGIYAYDGKHFKQFSKAQGMLSTFVYQLVIDHYGNIWTTHREGFSRYVRETNVFTTYPAKEYVDLAENPVTNANIDALGNIWFSTKAGVMRYNWFPSRNKMAPPFIFIESVEIDGKTYPADTTIELPYGAYNLKFNYLGLIFVRQEEVRYQYKLEGRSPDWSELTPQTFVTFQGLEDGEYTFYVRAYNDVHKYNEAPARFSFVINPPFWKTWWFRGLLVLLIAGLVYGYIRYRVYRLNKEKAALELKVKERTMELQLEKEKVEKANLELEKLSLVASETDNAVFIMDANGKLIWVNNGFTRLTGLRLEDLLQRQGNGEFIDSSDNPKVRELLNEAIEHNHSVQYESKLPTANGTPVWVVSTLTPILDPQGKVRNIVIIDSNITDRKIAEEKIRQMNAELESLVAERTRELAETNEELQVENAEHIKTSERLKVINAELDSFVYRASHDLKGPLASLIGLINIAGMELGDNAIATRYLGLMDKASKKLDLILIDLIEATQVKQRTVEMERFVPLRLAESILNVLKNQMDVGKVEIELSIAPELELVSDTVLLTSVLQNYLGNAIKYRDTKKEIQTAKLAVALVNGNIEIQAQDNGIGIGPEMQGRVFDMFFKGSSQTGGSGLGLYIVKQAVEKLGGSVRLESTLGEGTTMFATIPNGTISA
jgi:PAS domain S-box-containing protein